jgi:hypothetical protein
MLKNFIANTLNIYKFSTNSNFNATLGCSNFNFYATYYTHSSHTSYTNMRTTRHVRVSSPHYFFYIDFIQRNAPRCLCP